MTEPARGKQWGLLGELLHRTRSPQPQVGPQERPPLPEGGRAGVSPVGGEAGGRQGMGSDAHKSVTLLTTLPRWAPQSWLQTQARLSVSHAPPARAHKPLQVWNELRNKAESGPHGPRGAQGGCPGEKWREPPGTRVVGGARPGQVFIRAEGHGLRRCREAGGRQDLNSRVADLAAFSLKNRAEVDSPPWWPSDSSSQASVPLPLPHSQAPRHIRGGDMPAGVTWLERSLGSQRAARQSTGSFPVFCCENFSKPVLPF